MRCTFVETNSNRLKEDVLGLGYHLRRLASVIVRRKHQNISGPEYSSIVHAAFDYLMGKGYFVKPDHNSIITAIHLKEAEKMITHAMNDSQEVAIIEKQIAQMRKELRRFVDN